MNPCPEGIHFMRSGVASERQEKYVSLRYVACLAGRKEQFTSTTQSFILSGIHASCALV